MQTVGVIASLLVSAYAVYATERNRNQETKRARIERVLQAVLGLTEAATVAQEVSGEGVGVQVARLRLQAALHVAGVKGFEQADLMTRPASLDKIVSQGEAAILEVTRRLDDVESRRRLHRR